MEKFNEEALIERAKAEREKIFQRYDLGRSDGATIDPWEDPQFEIYHQTDRYGFIHDRRLPKKHNPHEEKQKEIEMERVKKWMKMCGKWDSKETQNKLHKRVYKGIPDKVRSRVWHKLLRLDEVMENKKNKYQEMLTLARHWSTEARQIDSDVNRQFREHIMYRERYSIKQKSLFNVLVAYSMYNMEVGYCQGMSGLAGVLLMYFDEEEAFWALSTLLSDKKYAMHGLFIEGFPKLTRFLAHHDKIIAKFIPKLKKHFDQYNLDSILYSLKWFFVVFVERIPFNLCLRVWDVYLLDGEKVVTAMAYTILRLHKSKILKLKDMDLIVQYIQVKMYNDFGYDDDIVMKQLEQCMDELRKANLDLPPPGSEIEFPKKPFGQFTEPTVEAKIGRRKSEFTETEKDVTENVKLRREITEQEIAILNDNRPVGGSITQINTVHIPESEDGGSLLGSSRKSLADTSITSTADLSVLSGGQSQRSHQALDFSYEDQKLGGVESENENEGESSPGSAFCSMSVVARSPSALNMTPTPRAMSPDVVRIYVPPPDAEELERMRKESPTNSSASKVSANVNRISLNDDETQTRRNSIIEYAPSNGRQSSSSSSRRGSMSRKSPAPLECDYIIECGHVKNQKYVPTAAGSSSNLSLKSNNSRTNSESNIHRFTSFEELAKNNGLIMTNNSNNNINNVNNVKEALPSSSVIVTSRSKSGQRMAKSEIYEGDLYQGGAMATTMMPYSNGMHKSDYNIQYKNISPPTKKSPTQYDVEYKSFKMRHSSVGSGNESSPFDYDLLPGSNESQNSGPLKNYSRFFQEDGEEEDEDEDRLINKSASDDSSASPDGGLAAAHHKSNLHTPINDTIPLLSPTHNNKYSIGDTDNHHQSSIPISSSFKKKSQIESFRLELASASSTTSSAASRRSPSSSTSSHSRQIIPSSKIPIKSPTSPPMAYHSRKVSSPTAIPHSQHNPRRTNNNLYDYKTRNVMHSPTSDNTNKIRIKINQSSSFSSN